VTERPTVTMKRSDKVDKEGNAAKKSKKNMQLKDLVGISREDLEGLIEDVTPPTTARSSRSLADESTAASSTNMGPPAQIPNRALRRSGSNPPSLLGESSDDGVDAFFDASSDSETGGEDAPKERAKKQPKVADVEFRDIDMDCAASAFGGVGMVRRAMSQTSQALNAMITLLTCAVCGITSDKVPYNYELRPTNPIFFMILILWGWGTLGYVEANSVSTAVGRVGQVRRVHQEEWRSVQSAERERVQGLQKRLHNCIQARTR